jgi:hypothetical protein
MGLSTLSKLLWAKVSLITVVTSMYFTYQYYQPLRRVAYNVLHRDVGIEQGFFRDPNGLYVDVEINENGNREAYLMHDSEGWKNREILEDGYFKTHNMLECIARRARSMDREEAKNYMRLIDSIEDTLYERIE